MTDRPIELPRWIRWIFVLATEAPWTNIKTMNALILANGTAVYLAIASFFRVAIDNAVLETWLIFVASTLGIAMVGAGIKRATYNPATPPGIPDVEDAAAAKSTTPTPPAAPARDGA